MHQIPASRYETRKISQAGIQRPRKKTKHKQSSNTSREQTSYVADLGYVRGSGDQGVHKATKNIQL